MALFRQKCRLESFSESCFDGIHDGIGFRRFDVLVMDPFERRLHDAGVLVAQAAGYAIRPRHFRA